MLVGGQDYIYSSGDLFLGLSSDDIELGLRTERHAITIAGSGAGKGACVIIPNLKRWPHNGLVIDPKGEAAKETAADRERMGQKVHVLNPFNVRGTDSRFQASINPLDTLQLDSPTIREDIIVIADGIVMRGHDAGAEHWDDGTVSLIAGVIAYVLLTEKGDDRNLVKVREIIANKGQLYDAMEDGKTMKGCGNLTVAGASACFAKEGEYFVSGAEKNTQWIDSEPMQAILRKSTFSLSELKHDDATIFLVLPANYLVSHGRFLRLFVRCALEAMAKERDDRPFRDRQCLFFLDEFFALGYINEVAVSAGLMRGYGLQLWPIMQDVGQLQKLYGQEGAETFFGNSDLHQFFGNTDRSTLQYISSLTGTVRAEEVGGVPVAPSHGMAGSLAGMMQENKTHMGRMTRGGLQIGGAVGGAISQARYNKKQAEYQQAAARINQPRMNEEEVSNTVQKPRDGVSNLIMCFCYGRNLLIVKSAPYFSHVPRAEEKNMKAAPLEGDFNLFGMDLLEATKMGAALGLAVAIVIIFGDDILRLAGVKN